MRSLRSKNLFTVQCLSGSSLPNRYQYSRRFSNLQEQIVKNAISESIFSFSEEKPEKLTKSNCRNCISECDCNFVGDRPCQCRTGNRKSPCRRHFLRQGPPVSLYGGSYPICRKALPAFRYRPQLFPQLSAPSPLRRFALPSGRRTFFRTAQSGADWSPPAPE